MVFTEALIRDAAGITKITNETVQQKRLSCSK
jgi:hypothetical protein